MVVIWKPLLEEYRYLLSELLGFCCAFITSDVVFGLDEHEDESFLRFGSFIDDLYPLFLQLLGAKDGEANIRVSLISYPSPPKISNGPLCKVGCVFLVVVVSMLLHAEIGRNDHRECAPHFNVASKLTWFSILFFRHKQRRAFWLFANYLNQSIHQNFLIKYSKTSMKLFLNWFNFFTTKNKIEHFIFIA